MSAQDCNLGSDYSLLFVNAADKTLKSLSLSVMNAVTALYTAESGTEALELLHRENLTLVLAPLDLGDMSGFEFCERVLELSPGTVIILIGSERGEAVYRQAMEAGAARYLLMEDAQSNLGRVIMECRKKIGTLQSRLELLKSFELHSFFLKNLPLPLLLLEPTGEIAFANKAFWRIAGYRSALEEGSLSQLLGNMVPLSPASGWDCLFDAVASDRDWGGEISCRRASGETVHLQITLFHLPAVKENAKRYKLFLMRDAGKEQALQKRLDRQRQSAFDLLEADRRQEESLNGMLLTLAQLTSGGLTSRQDQDTQTLLRQIHLLAASEREQGYLATLLNSRTSQQRKTFSLRSTVSAVQASFFQQSNKQNITLHFNIPEYVPDLYSGDDTAVIALLSSLLENSLISGNSEGALVSVDLKEKTAKGILLQFTISFGFSGVSASSFTSMPEFLMALQQGRETGKQTGLNLAVELTEILGGKIWVKSEAGKGRSFCFSVSIPEAAGQLQPVSEPARLPAGARLRQDQVQDVTVPAVMAQKLRILLADDNEIDQLAILTLLERCGYLVTMVSNGREAVDEFDCADYDVVVMDILMPVMDGFEAARLIREKERVVGTHTPIYALTSYSLKAVQDKCAAVGMDGYLSKPVSVVELSNLFAGLAHSAKVTHQGEKNGEPAILGIRETLLNLGGNLELYKEIVQMFRDKAPAVHGELLEALRSGNATEAEQLAHKLKGMSSNVGGARYAEITSQIQDNMPNDIPGSSSDWEKTLEREFQELAKALSTIDWQSVEP